ncbi:hypothetical protein [Halobacterium zhouii]|uniref:hypothetical protein n=1 Tax=Halobacterium zhouii TaxID=2902624 RepID=UPI001E6212CC|nr:hypothetical protein [Halobacterium zhouii]
MSLLSTLLFVLGGAHLFVGVPSLLVPGFVRERLPTRYADAVGDRREWRRFGAGVTGIGGSLLIVAWSLAG